MSVLLGLSCDKKQNNSTRNPPRQVSLQRLMAVFVRYSGMKRLFLTRSFKKDALSKLIQRNTCQPAETPYNAPPSTRHTGNGKRVEGSED
ncbi:hypothetical protein [Pantoea anthophila]|uniref:hypothetical protein n=2 Tax=Pantoea anthophila TaxID=470931 RepID=UPI00301C7950